MVPFPRPTWCSASRWCCLQTCHSPSSVPRHHDQSVKPGFMTRNQPPFIPSMSLQGHTTITPARLAMRGHQGRARGHLSQRLFKPCALSAMPEALLYTLCQLPLRSTLLVHCDTVSPTPSWPPWLPERPAHGQLPVQHERLAKLGTTFAFLFCSWG